MALRKTAAKKAATATAKKVATPKAKAEKKAVAKTAAGKKAATKKTPDNNPGIKKGSKLACQVCGFAITVDRVCGCMEEAHLVCCDTPMKIRRTRAFRK